MDNEIASLQAQNFLEGRLILIDKPVHWTSFDVVKKLRYLIKQRFALKKIKVGHAGTLDPLATGLLIICTGQFTKKIAELTLQSKSYEGKFVIGATTPSYDLETEIVNPKPWRHLNASDIQDAVRTLAQRTSQIPPAYSAKWVNGKRAYESARKGEDVLLKAQLVHIDSFEISCEKLPEIDFSITCSKGTYIRSLAHDLGGLLGCGAYLSMLRRTAIGTFEVADAYSLSDLEKMLEEVEK